MLLTSSEFFNTVYPNTACMDAIWLFLGYSLAILAVSMVGACLPRIGNMSDRTVHRLVALSAGIFIGLLFLLLLPEGMEECEESGIDAHDSVWALLAGFLLILCIDTLMKHRHSGGCVDELGSAPSSVTSLVGLSIHAACDGLALASTFLVGETVAFMTTVGMCIHKFVVLFSLSALMLSDGIERRRALRYLLGFGLVTPVAGIAFFLVLDGISGIEGMYGLPLMFAAGTFMYVALCDILPEAFHRDKHDATALGLIIVGVALIALMTIAFPHVH